jgi:signal transduction histidine kinase
MAGRHERGTPARQGRTVGARLDRVPFRRKLDALVVLPAVLIVALLTPNVMREVSSAQTWSSAASYMQGASQVSVLIGDLSAEQDTALGLIGPDSSDRGAFSTAIGETDAQIGRVRPAFGRTIPPGLDKALAAVEGLAPERTALLAGQRPAAMAVAGTYESVMVQLSDSLGLLKQAADGSPPAVPEAELDITYGADFAVNLRNADLVALADRPASGLVTDYTQAVQEDAIVNAEEQQLPEFGPASDVAIYDSISDDPQAMQLDSFEKDIAGVLAHTTPSSALDLPGTAATETNAAFTEAVARKAMEGNLSDAVVARAQHSSRVATWTAIALVLLAVFLLCGLVLLSVMIRHSVARPVLRLTRAAARIAEVAEQDLQRVADDEGAQESGGPPELESVTVVTNDEIGDLAEAFDRLQNTAVRVLERQVAIRRNTAEMFGNVGRRIHNLTGRQLSLIDAVERSETDPVLLERLYRIDHLAVRLQRGADSLVLLSGERETDFDATPMAMSDVVRSAIGRIEGYQRVVLSAEGDALVSPSAVGDLTLMVAELVENAVAFSPVSSSVEVTVRGTSHGALIEIVDRGVGMSPARLIAENARLVARERLDLVPIKVLGLFVVGRLAQRTGARVELAPTPGGGLTVRIALPTQLLLQPLKTANGISTPIAAPRPAPALRSLMPGAQMPEPRRDPDEDGALPRRRPGEVRGSGATALAEPALPATPLLPRRVRGAAAQSAASAAGPGLSLAAPTDLDAEAARAEIEEFEAGVDLALRESGHHSIPPRQAGATAHPPTPGDTDEQKGPRI